MGIGKHLGNSMRFRLLCLLPLLLLPSLAAAFSSSAAGNITTYTGFTAAPANIGKYAVSAASDGTILVNSGGKLNVPGGGSIPINVTGSIPRPTASAAIGRFLARGVPLVATAAAVYALAQELGFTLSDDGGALAVSKPSASGACDTSGGGRSYITGNGTTTSWPTFQAQACPDSRYVCVVSYPKFGNGASCNPTVQSTFYGTGGFVNAAQPVAWLFVPRPLLANPVLESSSIAQLENAIAQKSGWPTDTAFGDAIKQVVALGEPLPVASPVVTGPALSPGPSSVTVDQSTGNTTTVTQTISNVYNGPTVTTTVITDTVVTDTATGAPVSQSTTTATPVVPESPIAEEAPKLELPCGIAGLPPCNVKVDEKDTPAEVSEDEFKPLLDDGRQAQEELLDTVSGDADKSSLFDGFADLFVTPALAECVPLEIPGDRGSIDPCGTVGGARAIMAYIWALSGLALCLHMVRKAL